MKRKSVTCGVLLLGALAAAASAQEPDHVADVQAGHHLALTVCAACHVVDARQPAEPILRPPAPAFALIANRRDTSAQSLGNFIANAHPVTPKLGQMPNPQLLPDQVADVVGYILSLKRQHQAIGPGPAAPGRQQGVLRASSP